MTVLDIRGTAILAICLGAVAGMLVRPWRVPEMAWACTGAMLLVVLGLITPQDAWSAILRGGDVDLFLAGMMLLSELARREGVFDWLASHAVGWSRGSPAKLFTLIYLLGVIVTAVLSNDATAVVMTPAVYTAARKAEADPLPALLACALVANAASFVLPISNPANLVMFDGAMPQLGAWFAAFFLPSVLAIGATYAMLRFAERRHLRGQCRASVEPISLSRRGAIALSGIGATGVALLVVSMLAWPLGLATFITGSGTALCLWLRGSRDDVRETLRGISWGILPLVAGLFVLVAGLGRAGLIARIAGILARAAECDPAATAAQAGTLVAVASNLVNNLPAGLVASTAIGQAHPPPLVTDAMLIGVDLGPNLSITGSLATILWLAAVRREGQDVTFWRFLRVGAVVMPPALILALAARIISG
jgi:arsenical pump membrane protein